MRKTAALYHCWSSYSAKAEYPVRRSAPILSQALWNTGSPLSRVTTQKELPLPLVTRQEPLHRPRPARKLALARCRAHRRLEAVFQPPVIGKLRRLGIDAGGKPREIGGAERGGFLDHRAIDRRVQQV